MKGLITHAEILVALRAHFAIADTVDINLTHVGGYEGVCALVDQAVVFGTEQLNAVADIAAEEPTATRKRRSPVKQEATEEEAKPATRRFGSKKKEEPVDEDDSDTEADADADADDAEVDQPKTTKKRFGSKAKSAPVEDEDDSEDVDADGDSDEEEEPEEKPATRKRTFGKAKPKAKAEPEEDEDEGDEEEEVEQEEEKPAKRTFGARKSVFGKK